MSTGRGDRLEGKDSFPPASLIGDGGGFPGNQVVEEEGVRSEFRPDGICVPEHGLQSGSNRRMNGCGRVVGLAEEVDVELHAAGSRHGGDGACLGSFQHDAGTGAEVIPGSGKDGHRYRDDRRAVLGDPLDKKGNEGVFGELGHAPGRQSQPARLTFWSAELLGHLPAFILDDSFRLRDCASVI